MKFYISDTHFGHKAMIDWDHRPFKDVNDMDEQIIRNWNDKVSEEDEVYILGDFTYRSVHDPEWYLEQLAGKKYLVIGNHDKKMLKNSEAMKHFKNVDKIMSITDCGKRLHLCHFPMLVWEGKQFGHIHLHGHLHEDKYGVMNSRTIGVNVYNVGCMLYDYTPVSLEEILKNNCMSREISELGKTGS